MKNVVTENNSFKYKSYRVKLAEKNEKNKLYHIIRSVGINKSRIMSDDIYLDVNKSRQNPYLKLTFAIYNFFDNNIVKNHNDKPRLIITYNLYNSLKSLND